MDPIWNAEDSPDEILGVRRHGDRCFHAVEEEYADGFIVDGILVPRDEVADVRKTRRSEQKEKGDGCPLTPFSVE